MTRRAEARDQTRDRIVRATMALHDEKGVSATTFADVAGRAGIGAATLLRHFPTVGALVTACGAHVAQEMRPPSPYDAAATFAGLTTTAARLDRLARELDAFYQRGARRLARAADDRTRIPELDAFLRSVDAGIEAMIREALADEDLSPQRLGVCMALASLSVWQRMILTGLSPDERAAVMADLFAAAIDAVRPGRSSPATSGNAP